MKGQCVLFSNFWILLGQTHLLGQQAMRERQLKKLGYKVMHVNLSKVNKLLVVPSTLRNYLKTKYDEAIKQAWFENKQVHIHENLNHVFYFFTPRPASKGITVEICCLKSKAIFNKFPFCYKYQHNYFGREFNVDKSSLYPLGMYLTNTYLHISDGQGSSQQDSTTAAQATN